MQNNHTVIQFPKKEQNARKGYGCVYVIGFSNGLVKVGKSINPNNRLNAHRLTLGCVADIVDTWVSGYHLNYSENESLLISKLNNNKSEIGNYDFKEIVSFAKTLNLYLEDEQVYKSRIKAQDEETKKRWKRWAVPVLDNNNDKCIDDDLLPLFSEMEDGETIKNAYIEIASLVTNKEMSLFLGAIRPDDIIDSLTIDQLIKFNRLQSNLTFALNTGLCFSDSIELIRNHGYANVC